MTPEERARKRSRDRHVEKRNLRVAETYKRYQGRPGFRRYSDSRESSALIWVAQDIRELFGGTEDGKEKLWSLLDDLISASRALEASDYSDEVLEGHLKASRSIFAKKGADAVHAEHRAMKSDVFKWLDDNGAAYEGRGKGKGIEAAARAITKQQPIVHSTARDWYKEWKRLHPASTP